MVLYMECEMPSIKKIRGVVSVLNILDYLLQNCTVFSTPVHMHIGLVLSVRPSGLAKKFISPKV